MRARRPSAARPQKPGGRRPEKLSPLFDEFYADDGRVSIPPEQLLKARGLTALYSVRSERLFCEQLGYNLLWLWFLDREFSAGSFDHSVFAKNYQRVLSADVAKLFFLEVSDLSRQAGCTSDDYFTADGTLIEAWASLKSFVRQDGADAKKIQSAKDADPGNPTVDFRGEKRRNDTHQSGRAALKGVLPTMLVCGVSFAGVQFLVSNYLGPQLVDILSSLAAIIALVVLLKFWKPKDQFKLEGDTKAVVSQPGHKKHPNHCASTQHGLTEIMNRFSTCPRNTRQSPSTK